MFRCIIFTYRIIVSYKIEHSQHDKNQRKANVHYVVRHFI